MAAAHPEAFLPSGAIEHDHRGHYHQNPPHKQPYHPLYANNHGFPPRADFSSPPASVTGANYFDSRSNRGSTRHGRTSAPSTGPIPPANGNSYFSHTTSSHQHATQPLPSSSSSVPLKSSVSSPSDTAPYYHGAGSPLSYTGTTNIDAAAYHSFASAAQQQPLDGFLKGGAYSPPRRARFAEATSARAHRDRSLSPNTQAIRNQQYRSSSLHPHFDDSPPAAGNIGSSLSRSVSADAAAPTQTPVHIVQRLAQQNAIIREAWEAERNYLEANRRRAEEVYQEERAIMEEVREGWEHERETMLREMQNLRERIQRLEGENTTLRAVAAQAVSISGVVSPLPSVKDAEGYFQDPYGNSSATHKANSRGQDQPTMSLSPPHGTGAAEASILPPGLNGASRRPHWASPGSGSRTSPNEQPEHSPFIPLEPRVEPQMAAQTDPLPHEDSGVEPPIIDVQEVDPKLEGIPIKANALQRPTFGFDASSHSENSKQSSPSKSPPPQDAYVSDSLRPEPNKRASSKEQTLQVLAAGETRRLTMHAGHTPNHSLSLFPTMNIKTGDGSSNATAPSDGPTPKAEPAILATEDVQAMAESDKAPLDGSHTEVTSGPADRVEPADDKLELGPLEPLDDVPLKGPLMIKNIPAQDEIFWSEVNKKLEPISQGQDSLPTVMRAELEELADAADGSAQALAIQRQRPRATGAMGGGDASQDPQGIEDGDIAPRPGTSGDGEVPLKLKSTTNFGAPFGMA